MADLTSMLNDVADNDEYDIPWKRLFCLSSDGPNINKGVWRIFNKKLKGKGYKGLAHYMLCTLDLGKEQVLVVLEKLQSSWLLTYTAGSKYIFVVL